LHSRASTPRGCAHFGVGFGCPTPGGSTTGGNPVSSLVGRAERPKRPGGPHERTPRHPELQRREPLFRASGRVSGASTSALSGAIRSFVPGKPRITGQLLAPRDGRARFSQILVDAAGVERALRKVVSGRRAERHR